jgi:hypothetical protein
MGLAAKSMQQQMSMGMSCICKQWIVSATFPITNLYKSFCEKDRIALNNML